MYDEYFEYLEEVEMLVPTFNSDFQLENLFMNKKLLCLLDKFPFKAEGKIMSLNEALDYTTFFEKVVLREPFFSYFNDRMELTEYNHEMLLFFKTRKNALLKLIFEKGNKTIIEKIMRKQGIERILLDYHQKKITEFI